MPPPKSTHCRFCREPDDLVKGAHRECKNKYLLEHNRTKRGIPLERQIVKDEPSKCKKCDEMANRRSKLGLCDYHMDENAKDILRARKREWARRKRGTPKSAPVANSGPGSVRTQKERVVKVKAKQRKKAAPPVVVDATPDEVRQALLAKAAAERVEVR